MTTPILDFVKNYNKKEALRLHMPGHKGKNFLGVENMDITEISGADVLYNPEGIIKESQSNAKELFGTEKTVYSCEGSSLSVRAMLYLALSLKGFKNKKLLATRNAHRVFMSGAALLDFEVEWLYPEKSESIISCEVSAEMIEEKLLEMKEMPVAVYITSPDYLGNVADVEKIAVVCHKHNVLLLCDNAHGAYLNFLKENKHPIALGADMCCDSAHKTLPVLTGGSYLHISKNAPKDLADKAEKAMKLFASTSPSYLILQSLDYANYYLSDNYKDKLQACVSKTEKLKKALKDKGFKLVGKEALKITIAPKDYGYTGYELAEYLEKRDVICEFADPDFIVFMFTTETGECEFEKLEQELIKLNKKETIQERAPKLQKSKQIMSPREAVFSDSEIISVSSAKGRILASDNVSCPPAIPIVVCGEEIDESAIKLFKYYGIKEVEVIK